MSATAGQCLPTAAARSSPARLTHTGELPGWRKPGVPVDVDQPVAAPSGQRHARADQDAAIAAAHQGNAVGAEHPREAIGEPPAVVDDGLLVAQPSHGRIGAVDGAGRHDDPTVPHTAGRDIEERTVHARLAQRFGGLRRPRHSGRLGWPQTQVAGRGDRCDGQRSDQLSSAMKVARNEGRCVGSSASRS